MSFGEGRGSPNDNIYLQGEGGGQVEPKCDNIIIECTVIII